MRKIILALSLTLISSPLVAKADTTYTYPADKPVLSIAVPDDWAVEPDDSDAKGLVITSPDEAIELDLWAIADHSDPEKMLSELEANGEEIDDLINEHITEFKITDKKKGAINGIEAVMVEGAGKSKDDGSPAIVQVMFLTPDNKQIFGLLYWGSEEAEKANEAALTKISSSIKKPS